MDSASHKTAIRCQVFGLVQGVFFRANTQEKALKLNLTGWVRNLPDGSVELEAHGDSHNINKLKEWLAVGPSQARVDKLEVLDIEYSDNYHNFIIKN